MSASPFFYIEVFNHKTNNWEKFDVYCKDNKGEIKPTSLWYWNGSHDIFSIMGFEHSSTCPDFNEMHTGLPINASPEMYKIFDEHSWTDEYDGKSYTHTPDVKWFNLADAKLYLKDHPTVVNTDEMYEEWTEAEDMEWGDVPKKYMDNPFVHFINRVESFLEVGSYWNWDRFSSDVRIIGWLSW